MKKSIFTQQFEITGTKRKVTGEIIVTMNNNTIHCMQAVHQVESNIDGIGHQCEKDLPSEDRVLEAIEKLKKSLMIRMQELADGKGADTFLDKLKKLGFNL